jgi:NAD(P)-dependent dehydrogenase (short-subunit alcohol dehydrogenase family)
MAGRLEGKVAVVTGAGSGIGEAIAERFCREGARVVVADISGRQNDTAKRLGVNCRPVQVDVSKGADVRSMMELTRAAFGRLDILCNNAGIDGKMAPTGEYDEEDFDHVWAVNGRSVFLGMRYAIPMMLATGGGSIVNTTSIASIVAFPTMVAYCAAKGAALQMTRTAAAEYAAQGIRVNAILPGPVLTGITRHMPAEYIEAVKNAVPQRRMADPSELANVALFLASDESSFMTGAAVTVDGGYTVL